MIKSRLTAPARCSKEPESMFFCFFVVVVVVVVFFFFFFKVSSICLFWLLLGFMAQSA